MKLEPEPWSAKQCAVLLGVAALAHVSLNVAAYTTDSRGRSPGEVLYLQLVFLMPLVVLASPLVRRAVRRDAAMRISATISLGALASLVVGAAYAPLLPLIVSRPAAVKAASVAVVDVVGLALAAGLFPAMYRRFLMPRRRAAERASRP